MNCCYVMKKKDLTKKMRWDVADKLAHDRLPHINVYCKDVTPVNSFYSKYGKRILDLIVSTPLLIITLPINVVIAIITFFDVGSPIFFKQERVGKNGKIFYIVKFRNMKNIYDDRGELLPENDRVTKFGRFMRKTSLDELLNFWSIIKGEMSIIGPRPLVPEYTNRYNKRHKARLSVRPGLECPPRGKIDHVWDWQEQFENDVWYVENISLKTDIHEIIQLFKFTFDRKNSSARAAVSRGTFMGYSEDGKAINMDGVPDEYIDSVINS